MRWVADLDPHSHVRIEPDERFEDLDLVGEVLDESLREACSDGLISGERTDYGSQVVWAPIEVTALGLRFSGHWPPAGREHHDGTWSNGLWAAQALPVLRKLRDGEYAHEYLSGWYGGISADKLREIAAANELVRAGYIDADVQDGGALSQMRLTRAGRDVLDPTPRDPVDDARQRLRTSPTDAVVHAVEVALGQRLRELGQRHGLIPADAEVAVQLSWLNDQLTGKNGPILYGKPFKKMIEAVLDARNEYAHGRGDTVPPTMAAWAIETVALLLEALPTNVS